MKNPKHPSSASAKKYDDLDRTIEIEEAERLLQVTPNKIWDYLICGDLQAVTQATVTDSSSGDHLYAHYVLMPPEAVSLFLIHDGNSGMEIQWEGLGSLYTATTPPRKELVRILGPSIRWLQEKSLAKIASSKSIQVRNLEWLHLYEVERRAQPRGAYERAAKAVGAKTSTFRKACNSASAIRSESTRNGSLRPSAKAEKKIDVFSVWRSR